MKSERVTRTWEFYRDNCDGFKEPMRRELRKLDGYVSSIEAENAKLRELELHTVECVRRMDDTSENGGCVLCPYQSIDYGCEFENRARVLGVEVNG